MCYQVAQQYKYDPEQAQADGHISVEYTPRPAGNLFQLYAISSTGCREQLTPDLM